MKNSELILKLIDTPDDNNVVICASGNFHKITGITIFRNKTILSIEVSIREIAAEKWEFYQSQYKNSSFIEK